MELIILSFVLNGVLALSVLGLCVYCHLLGKKIKEYKDKSKCQQEAICSKIDLIKELINKLKETK